MTAKELDKKFATHGKRNNDFIDWVKIQTGQIVYASEVSQHRNGKREMSRYGKALYTLYFKILELQ